MYLLTCSNIVAKCNWDLRKIKMFKKCVHALLTVALSLIILITLKYLNYDRTCPILIKKKKKKISRRFAFTWTRLFFNRDVQIVLSWRSGHAGLSNVSCVFKCPSTGIKIQFQNILQVFLLQLGPGSWRMLVRKKRFEWNPEEMIKSTTHQMVFLQWYFITNSF